MSIDFQGLLNVLKAGESEPYLKMDAWEEENVCGTSHCLIGAFCTQHPLDALRLKQDGWERIQPTMPYRNTGRQLTNTSAIAERFGISVTEAQFLFTTTIYGKDWPTRRMVRDAAGLAKEAALNRLRKFIYYKLHKAEMTLEEGRKVEGNRAAVRAAKLQLQA
jgi:hypothetical protein